MSAKPTAGAGKAPADPLALVRTRGYAGLLLVAAVLGAPISAAAFGFLALVNELQSLLWNDLPKGLGFHGTPSWWAIPLLVVAGVLVGLTIRYLPGTAGHKPAHGLSTTGATRPVDIPGVALAALASLGAGAVIGPEAPLIALGSGLAVAAVQLSRRDLPPQAVAVVGASGSFAAVSTLLGSPLLGAFLLMEASGLGGPLMGVVLVPGLLAAGVGSLIFVGLGSWTGLGTYSLAIHNVPPAGTPTYGGFAWALGIGVLAALAGTGIRRLGLYLEPRVERRMVLGTALLGLAVGLLALIYAEATGKSATEVLYSGQSALNPLLGDRAEYSVGALVLLVACKSLAYSVSLAGFRGGPVFPSMFVGAAGGLALSHLPGLPDTAGFAMGIGAMCVSMLRLPMTAVLLATLLLGTDGLAVMPLVIVAVVVSYFVTLRLAPAPAPGPDAGAAPGAAGAAAPGPTGP
ncbi:chloride channel protein [Kitasatospora sp. NPDC094015]|uniref:chloride channel protein n=1 Tax=Kitasatospora sp. NPDC094015 TaxID=3155205 RepID=UPI003326F5FC